MSAEILELPSSDNTKHTPPISLTPRLLFPSPPLEIDDYAHLLAPHLPAGVDPTKMNLAYGRRAVPKLVIQKMTCRVRVLVLYPHILV